jgi:hypothetical protein
MAADFLRHLIEGVPYRVNTLLNDNGTTFLTRPTKPDRPLLLRACLRICVCPQGRDHRQTKPKHPWTNGQVERMNRTINVRMRPPNATSPKLTMSCEFMCATSTPP